MKKLIYFHVKKKKNKKSELKFFLSIKDKLCNFFAPEISRYFCVYNFFIGAG